MTLSSQIYIFSSQVKDIAQIVWNVAEGMKFIKSTFENDFVILKLGSPLQFNIDVQPACLPTSKNFLSLDSTEYMCFTSGWGTTQHGKLFLSTSCYLRNFIVCLSLI